MGRICLCLCLAAGAIWAQKPAFQSEVDLLQIPVTVLNRRGDPVPGLKAADFSVKIDGHAIPVTALDEIHPAQPASASLPTMPPQTYSNLSAQVPAQRLILLIDYAHIPAADLIELNREMHHWLARPWPAGVQVAVFSFDRNLTLLQPFTSDPKDVLATLQDMIGNHPGRGQLEGLNRELTYLEGTGAEVKADLFDGGNMGPDNLPVANDPLARLYERIAGMLRHMQEVVERGQAIDMLNTWEAFSRLLSGIPGRKNVIWLTSASTLLAANDHDLLISQGRLHTVFAELDQANVALFPVDVTRLESYTQAIDNPNLGRIGPPPADSQTAIRARGLEDRQMDWAARETGGEAFGPSNQVGLAFNQIIRATRESYLLSVTPPRDATAGKIHRIEISVSGHGRRVHYRRSWLPASAETVADGRKQFLADASLLAFNPLTLSSLTLVAKTGAWNRLQPTSPATSAAGTLPFVVTTELTPLLHRNAEGQQVYDFSFLRILLPLDGFTDPVLLPPTHFHSTLPAGASSQRQYAVRIRSDSGAIAPGHPYLLRLIVRDNINGRAGSLSLRLNAPLPTRRPVPARARSESK